MAASKLKARLSKALEPAQEQETEAFRAVVGMLRDTASVIEAFLKKGAPGAEVSVNVVPGHSVNTGLEHRLVVRAPSHGISDYLLRAYVPLTGYPVVLDAMDEEDVTFAGPEAFEGALVGLMEQQWLRERLLGLREVLRDPATRAEGRGVGTVRRAAGKRGRPRAVGG